MMSIDELLISFVESKCGNVWFQPSHIKMCFKVSAFFYDIENFAKTRYCQVSMQIIT